MPFKSTLCCWKHKGWVLRRREVQLLRVAGRLGQFIDTWKVLTNDLWVLQTVKGFRIPFASLPTQGTLPTEPVFPPEQEPTDLSPPSVMFGREEPIQNIKEEKTVWLCKTSWSLDQVPHDLVGPAGQTLGTGTYQLEIISTQDNITVSGLALGLAVFFWLLLKLLY